MRKLIIIVSAMLALTAHAGTMVLKVPETGNGIRAIDSPCTNLKVLGNLQPQYHVQFKSAEVTLDGKLFAACWTSDPDGDVYVILEDGRDGIFHRSAFKDEPGV